MIKITFPNITIDESIKLVEDIYGVMYWDHQEKNKIKAYPLGVNNPVVIEHNGPKTNICTCEMHDRVYYGCRCGTEKQPNASDQFDQRVKT